MLNYTEDLHDLLLEEERREKSMEQLQRERDMAESALRFMAEQYRAERRVRRALAFALMMTPVFVLLSQNALSRWLERILG